MGVIMSAIKFYLENLAYAYQKKHPEMDIEEIMEKIVEGEIKDENV